MHLYNNVKILLFKKTSTLDVYKRQEILQWNKMQHIPSRHKCLVFLHLGSGGMKKSRCTI